MKDSHGSQDAARLTEDICDVLGTIRKLIAADEAAGRSPRREGQAAADSHQETETDPAEDLARRYGGEAGLARRLAGLRNASDWSISPSQPRCQGKPADDIAPSNPDSTSRQEMRREPPWLRPIDQSVAMRHRVEPVLRQEATSAQAAAASEVGCRVEPIVRPPQHNAQREVERPENRAPQDPSERKRPLQLDQTRRVVRDVPDVSIRWSDFARPDDGPGEAEAAENVVHLTHQTVQVAPEDDDASFAEAFEWKASLTGQISPREVDCQDLPESHADVPSDRSPIGASAQEDEQIREILREMIREEMHGDLGQRFSQNLRAVIRREVAAAIDDQLDRL